MKLEEFYNQAQSLGADKNDVLMLIVKNMRAEQARLKDLRSKTQCYLIPVKGKPAFDPDCQTEVESLAGQIEGSKANIRKLQEKINKIDAILAKYQVERPLLKEIRQSIGGGKNSIEHARTKVGGTLGHVLSFKVHDEDQAKKHPEYLKAVKDYETRKADLEPKIAKLEKALAELEGVLDAERSTA